jgi:hypothetical protein
LFTTSSMSLPPISVTSKRLCHTIIVTESPSAVFCRKLQNNLASLLYLSNIFILLPDIIHRFLFIHMLIYRSANHVHRRTSQLQGTHRFCIPRNTHHRACLCSAQRRTTTSNSPRAISNIPHARTPGFCGCMLHV